MVSGLEHSAPLYDALVRVYRGRMSDPIMFPAPADPKTTKMIISANVRRLMTERSVTQMALAGAMDLPQPSVSKRLRGVVAWNV
jgi:hypothetical protein